MSINSVGPAAEVVHPIQQREECATIRVEALEAHAADSRDGRAGEEAKPSSKAAGKDHHLPRHRPGDSDMAPDEPNDMISQRRNADRDEIQHDAPVETETPGQ